MAVRTIRWGDDVFSTDLSDIDWKQAIASTPDWQLRLDMRTPPAYYVDGNHWLFGKLADHYLITREPTGNIPAGGYSEEDTQSATNKAYWDSLLKAKPWVESTESVVGGILDFTGSALGKGVSAITNALTWRTILIIAACGAVYMVVINPKIIDKFMKALK
jgi:hypothetical protein